MSEEKQEKKMNLKDNDETQFIFRMYIKDNSIHFCLQENNLYVPFTFENSFTMDDFIERHKIFKACEDLEEVYKHLEKLYDKEKIFLYNMGDEEHRYLIIKVDFISEENEETQEFEVDLKMTEEKDRDLLELYNIQKQQIAKLKKIKELITDKNGVVKEFPIYKKIYDIIEECESKVDF